MIVQSRTRRRLVRAAGLATVAAGLIVVACEMPIPTTPDSPSSTADDDSAEPALTGAAASTAYDDADFTPYTAQPEMRNREEVIAAVRELHPPLLRNAGIGGTVTVWFRISEAGQVVEARVAEGSGREELDRAALEVARRAEFTPARNGAEPVAVWVQIPITFSP